jgi:SAM-dependent methyltransferase
MGIKRAIARAANTVLHPLGTELVNYSTIKPWDEFFKEWIAEAEKSGGDPNDFGDVAWLDSLQDALERYYLPHIHSDSVVLELGPGSGRLTRHIIGRCRKMILVDYSHIVCDWLERYLKGKGDYLVVHIDKPVLFATDNNSVDTVIANGVFEHIDLDDFFCFLEEFHRVLKLGGVVSLNFDNLMSEGGLAWYHKYRGEPGSRCLFRFYHPDGIRFLAEQVGFQIAELHTDSGRIAQLILRKPPG